MMMAVLLYTQKLWCVIRRARLLGSSFDGRNWISYVVHTYVPTFLPTMKLVPTVMIRQCAERQSHTILLTLDESENDCFKDKVYYILRCASRSIIVGKFHFLRPGTRAVTDRWAQTQPAALYTPLGWWFLSVPSNATRGRQLLPLNPPPTNKRRPAKFSPPLGSSPFISMKEIHQTMYRELLLIAQGS